MMIRGDRLGEEGEIGIAVADLQIPENLVIRSILLHDVNHMFDSVPQELHHGMVFLVSRNCREVVVLGDLPRALGQTGAGWSF
jgi:hypothetical protein